jgi:hypothetical protein
VRLLRVVTALTCAPAIVVTLVLETFVVYGVPCDNACDPAMTRVIWFGVLAAGSVVAFATSFLAPDRWRRRLVLISLCCGIAWYATIVSPWPPSATG